MKENVLIAASVIILLAIGGYAVYKFGGQNQTNQTSPETNQIQSMHLVTLKTTLGDISFETYDQDAPNTVKNFIDLANKKFYDGILFHRVIKDFMDQTGDPLTKDPSKQALWGTGGPGYKFADELDPNTQSYKQGYVKGVVAMANSGPNTNGSQFFIMAADYNLPHSYTIFGKVIVGQEVVDAINNVPTDQNDRPLTPVKILSVTVGDK
jgi:cyclophilin family peptidyl-prolyl cis-trans isomerase